MYVCIQFKGAKLNWIPMYIEEKERNISMNVEYE